MWTRLVVFLAVVPMLAHSILGCCWHHVHAEIGLSVSAQHAAGANDNAIRPLCLHVRRHSCLHHNLTFSGTESHGTEIRSTGKQDAATLRDLVAVRVIGPDAIRTDDCSGDEVPTPCPENGRCDDLRCVYLATEQVRIETAGRFTTHAVDWITSYPWLSVHGSSCVAVEQNLPACGCRDASRAMTQVWVI